MTTLRIALISLLFVPGAARAQTEVRDPDLSRVSRKVIEQPAPAGKPGWLILLFGASGEHRVLLRLDKGAPGGDRLHIDLDGDGRLGEDGEVIEDSRPQGQTHASFERARLSIAGLEHTDFSLQHVDEDGSFRLEWTWGGKVKCWAGRGFGPGSKLRFAADVEKAPVLVCSARGPIHYFPLFGAPPQRGRPCFFAVKAGRRGSEEAAYTWMDLEALPGFTGVQGRLRTDGEADARELAVLRYDGFNCQGYASVSLRVPPDAPAGPAVLELHCPEAGFPQAPLEHRFELR